MTRKDARRLRVGVLGCGPIAQFAHLEACVKARNADLHAICDAAPDLLARMQATYAVPRAYGDFDAMLADSEVEAVIVATSDAFHVPMSIRALEAGKAVLCEKPIGVAVGEVEELRAVVARTGRILQVGHMKRFDPGLEAARDFNQSEMGELLALKAWYCDSTHRYTMTDAIQPLPQTGAHALRPDGDPKADRRRYNMLAHGSHLVDLARYLAGPIRAVHTRFLERYASMCWFVDVDFESGALGHLDLTLPVRMDWHEGFHVYGEHGSAIAKIHNPWFYRSSDVDIFREADGASHRVLGADGHFYRRQLEGFAEVVLTGTAMNGASIDDGVASVRAMVAISRSAAGGEPVALADVTGPV
jgi:predicted dehydrogenase